MESNLNVLGNRTNDHQKAFMELLGMAAQHLAYVAYASNGISAGGRRYPRQKARAAAARPAQPPVSLHRLITRGGGGGGRTFGGAMLSCGPRGEGEGGGGTGGLDALYGLVNHCNPIWRPKKTDRLKPYGTSSGSI